MNTVTPIELWWIILSLLGAIISAANLMDAIDDRTFAQQWGTEDERLVAADMLRTEATRVLCHLLFLAVGADAALLPSSPEAENLVALPVLALLFVPVAFFVVQLAMITNSLFARVTRKRLVRQRLLKLLQGQAQDEPA
jgi:hypothetical protein